MCENAPIGPWTKYLPRQAFDPDIHQSRQINNPGHLSCGRLFLRPQQWSRPPAATQHQQPYSAHLIFRQRGCSTPPLSILKHPPPSPPNQELKGVYASPQRGLAKQAIHAEQTGHCAIAIVNKRLINTTFVGWYLASEGRKEPRGERPLVLFLPNGIWRYVLGGSCASGRGYN